MNRSGYKLLCLFLILVLQFLVTGASAEESETIRIGVLAKRGAENAMEKWGATADYLSESLPGRQFKIVPLDFYSIVPSVSHRNVDFILANPSFYVELEANFGVIRIATLKNRVGDRLSTSFAGVVFVRADRSDIRKLSDLKEKRFFAVEENSLGGFHMALGEMRRQGIDPYTDTELGFGGTHDNVVYAVRDGKADAGTVRTDTLERMWEEGLINLDHYRVINRFTSMGINGFPFQRSTPLYPEWPFAALAHVPQDLAEAVASALMAMPQDSRAARDSKSAGWGVPLNYQPVHDLLRTLKIGLYKDFGRITFVEVVKLYWYWLVLGSMALIAMMLVTSHVTKLNKHLRVSRYELSRARDQLEERVEERTRELARSNEDLGMEIEERKQAQLRFERLSHQNRLLLDSAGEGIFGVNTRGHLTFINPQASKMLGWELEVMMGQSMHDLTHHTRADGSVYPKNECMISQTMRKRQAVRITDELFWRKSGEGFPVEYQATPIIENGRVVGAVVVFKDITERLKAEESLKQSAAVFDNTAEAILISDANNRIIKVNDAFIRITGYRREEVIGKDPKMLSSGKQGDEFYRSLWNALQTKGQWVGEIWNRRKSGEIYPEWLSISAITNERGQISNYIAVFNDISPVKQTEERLQYLAHHDPLTGLPNRLLLQDRLAHAVRTAHRNKQQLAVLFIDLDGFKEINDTHGHQLGDALLEKASRRLRSCLREGDTVARLGGDEFIVILEQTTDREGIVQVVEKILEALRKPMKLQGLDLNISGSIGISLYPDDALDCQDLVKRADTAMYQAKQNGRNGYAFFDQASIN